MRRQTATHADAVLPISASVISEISMCAFTIALVRLLLQWIGNQISMRLSQQAMVQASAAVASESAILTCCCCRAASTLRLGDGAASTELVRLSLSSLWAARLPTLEAVALTAGWLSLGVWLDICWLAIWFAVVVALSSRCQTRARALRGDAASRRIPHAYVRTRLRECLVYLHSASPDPDQVTVPTPMSIQCQAPIGYWAP